jgi:SAM-dependent methyltransferase
VSASSTLTRQLLIDLAGQYPEVQRAEQLADVDRIYDHISIVQSRVPKGGAILDLCGGIGLFSVGCAAVGMTVTLVDDFGDANNKPIADEVLTLHRKHGVEVVVADVLEKLPNIQPNSLDAVTCFDAMEHWNRSIRRVLHEVVSWLRPGGLFVLQTPNCVNLRKRLSVPFGKGKWSGMEYWYEQKVFRGHVREPDVEDLLYIGRDLALEDVRILGRNWLGYGSQRRVIRVATKLSDTILRLRPSLCSNIYLHGRKPLVGSSTSR